MDEYVISPHLYLGLSCKNRVIKSYIPMGTVWSCRKIQAVMPNNQIACTMGTEWW